MTRTVFRYAMDPATKLPRLAAPAGALTPQERARLKRQLRRHYRRLLDLDGRMVKLGEPLEIGPALFRVTVRPGSSARVPTVLLEHVRRKAPTAQPEPVSRWLVPFLATARWLARALRINGRKAHLVTGEIAHCSRRSAG